MKRRSFFASLLGLLGVGGVAKSEAWRMPSHQYAPTMPVWSLEPMPVKVVCLEASSWRYWFGTREDGIQHATGYFVVIPCYRMLKEEEMGDALPWPPVKERWFRKRRTLKATANLGIYKYTVTDVPAPT